MLSISMKKEIQSTKLLGEPILSGIPDGGFTQHVRLLLSNWYLHFLLFLSVQLGQHFVTTELKMVSQSFVLEDG